MNIGLGTDFFLKIYLEKIYLQGGPLKYAFISSDDSFVHIKKK